MPALELRFFDRHSTSFVLLVFGGPVTGPRGVVDQDLITRRTCFRVGERKGRLCGFSLVELGGLEPPTSWCDQQVVQTFRAQLLDQTLTMGQIVSTVETEKAALAALSLVELGGLEPPTSWVRFRRKPSPPFVMLRH